MTYSEKLRDPRWQKKRLEILQRDEFTCTFCYDTKTTLHVHHLIYEKNPWDVDDDALITLCEHCHTIVEYYKEIDWVKLKKYKCAYGQLFIIQLANGKIVFEILDTINNTITELAVFHEPIIQNLHKYFRIIKEENKTGLNSIHPG